MCVVLSIKRKTFVLLKLNFRNVFQYSNIMTGKDLWLNLPVKDVKKSQAFYTSIGFKLNEHYNNNEHSCSFFVGEKDIVLMLFNNTEFSSITGYEIPELSIMKEVIISFSAESREEVKEFADIVKRAGGKVNREPVESQGWLFGLNFEDPDGHCWNLLYMDRQNMPQ